jgi:Holliday junction resolvase RusA-like endonuclease
VTVQFIVPGEPQPQERARRGARGRWYTPSATKDYQERVRWAWRQSRAASFGEAPITMSVQFHFARPRSHFGSGRNAHTLKASALTAIPVGDIDNMLKSVFDGLQSLAFVDDRQIVCLWGVHKMWADRDGPCTVIDMWSAHPLEGLAA